MSRKIALALSIVFSAFFIMTLLPGCKTETVKKEDAVFRKINSTESGITFSNNIDENYQRNYFDTFAYVYNGAGVATGDFNNDGLMDIYFTGNEVTNKLYLNKGNMKFADISK